MVEITVGAVVLEDQIDSVNVGSRNFERAGEGLQGRT
jgi:hypothetical protein